MKKASGGRFHRSLQGVSIPLLIKMFADKTVWFISTRMKPHKYRDEESVN
jgi:hypothetical protein